MPPSKVALITGITGQDGSILAEFLLNRGYRVHGLCPYTHLPDTARIDHIKDDITLHDGDMTDGLALARTLSAIRPDEIYNLAALSYVPASFAVPETTANINALGTLRLLESVRTLNMEHSTRIYQASSSEMFGRSPPPQNESTPFAPCSPYGTAKLYAYWTIRNYREAYGLHASNGILFNHESPVRGEEFVTRKITRAACAIAAGTQSTLRLGNLDTKRDWGHARDYMEGAWKMLQQDTPGDYVLATGQAHSVREFAEKAFTCAGLPLIWKGSGQQETGIDKNTGKTLITVDPALFRPTEINCLIGNSERAKKILGWSPRTSFDNLIREMIETDRIIKTQKQKYGT